MKYIAFCLMFTAALQCSGRDAESIDIGENFCDHESFEYTKDDTANCLTNLKPFLMEGFRLWVGSAVGFEGLLLFDCLSQTALDVYHSSCCRRSDEEKDKEL